MHRSLVLAAGSIALLVACSDGGGSTSIDAAADAPVDAAVCERLGYPMAVTPLAVDLRAATTLTLSGTGTRCEQIIAALIGPVAGRPPELAQLDTTSARTTCEHDDITNREIVRVFAPMYAGRPLYAPVQDALVHVDASNTVVFLHADYLPLGATVVDGCLGDAAITAIARTTPLTYQRFAACSPQGPGSYALTTGDPIELGQEGFYLDEQSRLRRVRAVDGFLAPNHTTTETINSDLFCCSTPSLDHCVGQRLFLDVITGELIGREPHCHTC